MCLHFGNVSLIVKSHSAGWGEGGQLVTAHSVNTALKCLRRVAINPINIEEGVIVPAPTPRWRLLITMSSIINAGSTNFAGFLEMHWWIYSSDQCISSMHHYAPLPMHHYRCSGVTPLLCSGVSFFPKITRTSPGQFLREYVRGFLPKAFQWLEVVNHSWKDAI